MNKKLFFQSAFTLIELLIVIGILSILATVVLLVINPAQLIKQSRDGNRLAEVNQINKALLLFQSFGGDSTNMGTHTKVYVSLPSSQSDCSDLGLPALGGGYTYVCSNSANYRKIDGTGWIPVDFTSIQSQAGTLFSGLPIDPLNTVANGLYYTYIPGSWALSATMESEKYIASNAATDGGQISARFEVGNEIALNANLAGPYQIPTSGLIAYWKFDETSGTSAADSSGGSHTGTLNGSTTFVSGKVGNAVNFGYGYMSVTPWSGMNFGTGDYTIMFWVNINSNTNNPYWFHFTYAGNIQPYFDSCNGCVPQAMWYTHGSTNNYFFGSILPLGTWHHIAISKSGSTILAYDDGVFMSAVSGTNTGYTESLSGMTAMLIGAWYPYTNSSNLGIDGKLDEFAIYSRALSVDEILAIYNGQN